MKSSLGLDYLSPHEPLGIFILIIGALFTAGTVYVFLNLDKDSIEETKRKQKRENSQKELLRKLYPSQSFTEKSE